MLSLVMAKIDCESYGGTEIFIFSDFLGTSLSLALIGWLVALARFSLVDQLRCWLAVLTARCELVGSKRVEENGEEFF